MKARWVLTGTALVVASCVSSAVPVGGPVPKPPVTYAAGPISLVAFDSCDSALAELRKAAAPYVSAYGIGNGPVFTTAQEDQEDAVAVPGSAQREAKVATPPTPSHSTTNTHEKDVDEPDLVKTDGRRVVSVVGGRLRVIDAASRTVTGTLALSGGSASQLLVHGDRALVVVAAMGIADRFMPGPEPTVSGTELVLVDLAGAPRVLGNLRVSGAYVDARQTGGTARVVVRSAPRIPFVHPDGTRSPADSLRHNREILGRTPIQDWLPRYELNWAGRNSAGQLVDCARVSHPAVHSATSMLTVLTMDLAGSLGTGEPVSVVAGGDTVYGTDRSLYVADDHRLIPERPRVAPPRPVTTAIHQFDIAQPGPPRHVASGEVSGTLLNQYSLSEFDGHLRVATTTGSEVACCARGQVPQPPKPQSGVTVLARRGNVLAQTGRVDGLGVGERIHSVRFTGPVGYVVTFRQTDPLYTLDLSNPTQPKVTGELKITGFSAYLHLLGDGKLIGVGQEATDQGRQLGTQVSLFDVTDPAAPRRVAQHHLPNSSSEVEFDPHAFLYWPANGLLVLPVTHSGMGRELPGRPVNGVLVLRLRNGTFTEIGTVRHPVSEPYAHEGIRRSLVISDQLWTVSSAGILVSVMDGLAQRAWLPFR